MGISETWILLKVPQTRIPSNYLCNESSINKSIRNSVSLERRGFATGYFKIKGGISIQDSLS